MRFTHPTLYGTQGPSDQSVYDRPAAVPAWNNNPDGALVSTTAYDNATGNEHGKGVRNHFSSVTSYNSTGNMVSGTIKDRVALGGCPPRAPTTRTCKLTHSVPQVISSLRYGTSSGLNAGKARGSVPGAGETSPERMVIAVGMALAGHPPHRSVRAELPHTALTLDADWQTSR